MADRPGTGRDQGLALARPSAQVARLSSPHDNPKETVMASTDTCTDQANSATTSSKMRLFLSHGLVAIAWPSSWQRFPAH
jgi:hypothetical protein